MGLVKADIYDSSRSSRLRQEWLPVQFPIRINGNRLSGFLISRYLLELPFQGQTIV